MAFIISDLLQNKADTLQDTVCVQENEIDEKKNEVALNKVMFCCIADKCCLKGPIPSLKN